MKQPKQAPRAPLHKHTSRNEFSKFLAGFGFAFQGLWYAIRTQRNVRVHLAMAILAILLGVFLHISAVEFALVFIAISGVFIAEMMNTAIELCVDLASPNYHPLAKVAKDVAAGAVLVNAILSIIIALFIFGPHLWALLFHTL
ncbi:diacylglycerol kinase family protein [Dictyobacter formicarum]|uniref:Diacylglycerol kinase n=1 Tax=Dictyobacter formicarum TaxID=2778368 RepID=A0ABQ3VGM5_9CHLR|nr:diacylglycerol kinase family protein [Dictyobacter formicarum]GHO84271.1 diacylglycerol kinase [Dictyobacter formicarum]